MTFEIMLLIVVIIILFAGFGIVITVQSKHYQWHTEKLVELSGIARSALLETRDIRTKMERVERHLMPPPPLSESEHFDPNSE